MSTKQLTNDLTKITASQIVAIFAGSIDDVPAKDSSNEATERIGRW